VARAAPGAYSSSHTPTASLPEDTLRHATRFARVLALCASVVGSSPPALAFDFVVTRSDDPAPDGCLADDCSLREAVIAANAGADADRILLSAGRYELAIPGTAENLAATGDLDLFEDVEIVGPGATMTTIDANGLDLVVHVFDVQVGASEPNVRLAGLTLAAGTNSGTNAAAISASRAILLVEACEVRDSISGSGIVVGAFSELTVRNSTIAGHPSLGLRVDQSQASLENVTIAANGESELHALSFATVTCSHCTISDPGDGDIGDSGISAASNATVTVTNSLVAGPCAVATGGTVTSGGGNLESPGHSCAFEIDDVADPLLSPLGDHGGPTRTFEPQLLTSPAVDLAGHTDCDGTDQRGAPRPVDGDLAPLAECDAGAVESGTGDPATPIFHDGFLQGDTEAWSAAVG
jgi:hypothetical protein